LNSSASQGAASALCSATQVEGPFLQSRKKHVAARDGDSGLFSKPARPISGVISDLQVKQGDVDRRRRGLHQVVCATTD